MEIVVLKIQLVNEAQEYQYGTMKLDYEALESTSTSRARKNVDNVKVEQAVNQSWKNRR
jgi:hypothetical protein